MTQQKEEERIEREEKIKRVEAMRRERELQKQRQEEEQRLKHEQRGLPIDVIDPKKLAEELPLRQAIKLEPLNTAKIRE
jgi:hypothetical protein